MVVKQIFSHVANFGDHPLHYRVVVCLLFLTSRKFLVVLGSGIVSCSVFCHYISLSVHNHVKQEVLYCVVDAGYGLGRSLGDCRPALPKDRITKWLKHKLCLVRRPSVEINWWQIWVSLSLEVHPGTVGIYGTGLWRVPWSSLAVG